MAAVDKTSEKPVKRKHIETTLINDDASSKKHTETTLVKDDTSNKRRKKHTETALVKDTSSKRRKNDTETTLVKDDPSSKRKKKHTETTLVKDTSSKRRKHLRAKHAKIAVSEVVTMDEAELDGHTRLLSSVTGKMARLPMYEEGPDDEEKAVVGTEKCVAGEEEREDNTGKDKEAAARYLTLWNSERARWSFRKKTQYWLLQNMYDKKKVSKENFKLMLLYLDGLHGNQRGLAKEKADKVKAQHEPNKDEVSESKIKYKRACKVLNTFN